MPTKPKSRPRSNQKAGRKKNTRTGSRAKQRASAPATRKRAPSRRRAAAKVAMPSRSSARTTSKGPGAGTSKTTTDMGEIIEWAEARGGAPATVRGTGDEQEEAGILRIDFPGGAGEDVLEHISWDEWFQKFEEKGLKFLYQEKTKDGKISRFFKLVKG